MLTLTPRHVFGVYACVCGSGDRGGHSEKREKSGLAGRGGGRGGRKWRKK
jgi:hypothetical protein